MNRTATAAFAAALGISLLAGCSSAESSTAKSPSPTSAAGSAATPDAASGKPDITQLTDSMVLTQAGFPAVSGGSYALNPVATFPPGSSDKECKEGILIRDGGQMASSVVLSGDQDLRVQLSVTGHTRDLKEWAGQCFSKDQADDVDLKSVELPGLPAGAIALFEDGRSYTGTGGRTSYRIFGYIRGVLIKVQGSPGNAAVESDVVTVFNNQADLLNSI